MTPATPQDTRTRLIRAGLNLFGHKGFEATSTRDIAALAETNIASIAYHFGSKAGLRTACAAEVGARVAQAVGDASPLPVITPAEARTRLEALLRAFVTFLATAPAAEDLVAFLLRELMEPGEVSDQLYTGFFEPKHRQICALWAAATGRPAESAEIRLTAFSLIGQAAYFRIARPFVTKRLGWDSIGPPEAEQIIAVLTTNLHAMLERSHP